MPNTPSPLRYPGGKTKLFPIIAPLVNDNIGKHGTYIEPFAGGSGLACKLLLSDCVDAVVLNDIDYCIYSFWHSCLNRTSEFCSMIQNCKVDLQNWQIQKNIYHNPINHSQLEIGFATFYLNRCNVSGIIQGGPIGGSLQKGKYGIDARFNKEQLMEKILAIGERKDQISLFNLDAQVFLQNETKNYCNEKTLFNIDPPYVKKGPLLYENSFSEDNHSDLASVIRSLPSKWIVTYDDNLLIRGLYSGFRQIPIEMKYSAGYSKKGCELLILSDSIDSSGLIPLVNI